jgi:hypothetical protein
LENKEQKIEEIKNLNFDLTCKNSKISKMREIEQIELDIKNQRFMLQNE